MVTNFSLQVSCLRTIWIAGEHKEHMKCISGHIVIIASIYGSRKTISKRHSFSVYLFQSTVTAEMHP